MRINTPVVCNSFRVVFVWWHFLLRAAAARQPWALLLNAFGVAACHVVNDVARPRRVVAFTGIAVLLMLLPLSLGCRTLSPAAQTGALGGIPPAGLAPPLAPSNERNWEPSLAVLPYAEFDGDLVTVHNIRNCTYLTETDYVVWHYDKTLNLNDLESVDFIKVPFTAAPSLAHTMLSFGFCGGEYLVVSVEARLEQGEVYSPLKGSLRQYELMYVVADERDVIQLRTEHRKVDVFVYPTKATPEQARALFVSMIERANKLRQQPEFYDTIANNCTTNIVQHINQLRPGRVPFDVRVLLPGRSDQLAYELGLLDNNISLEETRRRAKVNDLARRHKDSSDFSADIRRF